MNPTMKTNLPLYPALVCAILAFLSARTLAADDYHNINGFIGERAAGLAGAYTAVADDPSGTYYNPAGIAFAYDNFISISASTYGESQKKFKDVFGPEQSYTRVSRTYTPNFFGALKDFSGWKFGFSIVSPITEDYDQFDQFTKPTALQDGTDDSANSFRIDYTERNTKLLIGPSLAKALSEKFSLGATLYYFYDSARTTSSQLTERKDDTYSSTALQDRRRTMGLLPVLGLQYMPLDWLSLGASVRRPFVTSRQRHKSGVFNSTAGDFDDITIVESTDRASASGNGSAALSGPPETGAVPENPEARLGAAVFLSRYLMATADVIYTEGYRRSQDNTQVDALSGDVYFSSPEIKLLTRRPTTNVAAGLEWYLTDNFALRLGAFTNRANSAEIDWGRRALILDARNKGAHQAIYTTRVKSSLVYNIPAFDALERFEHVDNTGYSLGLSWGDARSSLTITYVIERGRGMAQIDANLLPQPLEFNSGAFYLVASTRT